MSSARTYNGAMGNGFVRAAVRAGGAVSAVTLAAVLAGCGLIAEENAKATPAASASGAGTVRPGASPAPTPTPTPNGTPPLDQGGDTGDTTDPTPTPTPTPSNNGNGNGTPGGGNDNGNGNGNASPTPTPSSTPTPSTDGTQCTSSISPTELFLSQTDSSKLSASAIFTITNGSGVRIISASQLGNGNAVTLGLSLQRIDGSGSSVVTVTSKHGAGNRGTFIVQVAADPACGSAQQLKVTINN